MLVTVCFATLVAHLIASLFQPEVALFAKYTGAIEGLADGTVPRARLLDFSPLYLASAYVSSLVSGVLGVASATLMLAVQRLLAAAAVTAFFALVASRLGRAWGLVAAAILALDSHLLIYVAILEPEILLLALLLGLLVLLERPGRAAAFLAGLLAACAVATRPTFLPVFFVVPLYFRMQPTRHWKRRSVAFLVPVLVGLAALLAWAQIISGSWRTPVMNPGTVAFEGNQPLSLGTSAIYPPLVISVARHSGARPDSAHEHYREVARVTEPDADVIRVNAMWSSRAKSYLLDHPATALSKTRQKFLYALHGFSWHDVSTAWLLDVVPSLPFSLLAVAALLGFLAEARTWRRALPFYVLAAVQLGVMCAFYVSARQRLVLLPALVYFAVCAARAVPRLTRAGVVLAGVLVLVLVLPLVLPDDAMLDEVYRRRGEVESEPLLGALRDDEIPLAAQRPEVVDALASSSWWVDRMRPAWVPQDRETLDESVADVLASRLADVPAHEDGPARFDLAHSLLRAGRPDAAATVLEPIVASGWRGYRGGRQPSDPRILMARIQQQRGDLAAARAGLRAVLDDEPGELFALADLAALAALEPLPGGVDDGAELVRLLDRYVGEADRRWLYGQALRRVGLAEEAVAELQPLAERLPELRDVWLQLSLALADLGRDDEAVAALLKANKLHPEPVLEVRAFADLARRWADAHPGDVSVQLLAVRILYQHGMFRDASRRLDALESRAGLSASDRAQIVELRGRLAPGL